MTNTNMSLLTGVIMCFGVVAYEAIDAAGIVVAKLLVPS